MDTGAPADAYDVNPTGGTYTAISAGTPSAFMVGLSPDGDTAYIGGVGDGSNAELGVVSLYPTVQSAGTIAISGPDTNIDAIAFAGGVAYYTSGLPDSPGDFGRIDLATGQETQLLTGVPFAHGMIFDPYSGTLILTGNHEIAQVSPATGTVVGTPLTVDLGSGYFDVFDLPWVDGHGHLFAAANNGQMVFVDYAQSGSVAASSDFMQTVVVDSYLDDIVG